ncbi:hypothetical protein L9F63_012144, partial [Diploptera punctata]
IILFIYIYIFLIFSFFVPSRPILISIMSLLNMKTQFKCILFVIKMSFKDLFRELKSIFCQSDVFYFIEDSVFLMGVVVLMIKIVFFSILISIDALPSKLFLSVSGVYYVITILTFYYIFSCFS